MKAILFIGLAVLLVMLSQIRRRPVLRIPTVLLVVLLTVLAVVTMLVKPDRPITKLYRSIDGAAGYVMADRMKADLSGGSGTVVLLQFLGAGDRIGKLVREQRRGVEEALEGTGFTVKAVGPDLERMQAEFAERQDREDSPWTEADLVRWVEAVENPSAIISFIGVPLDLGRAASWPPIYTMQLDTQFSYRDLMDRGIIKAVVKTNGKISPLELPEQALLPGDLFALRYELVTDSGSL